jgi:hypothetical protein
MHQAREVIVPKVKSMLLVKWHDEAREYIEVADAIECSQLFMLGKFSKEDSAHAPGFPWQLARVFCRPGWAALPGAVGARVG